MIMAACVSLEPVSEDVALERSKAMIKELGGNLSKHLKASIISSGFVKSIDACSTVAQETPKEMNKKSRGTIRRVSLKLRNMKNAPDDYEKTVLLQMEKDHEKQELKDIYKSVVKNKRGKPTLRVMKPILVKSLCLNCHGTPYTWKRAAIKKVLEIYPNDMATGYASGEVRGAFSVVYPLQ
ncbi:hypothetical protein MNBD_NITROSPINAE01-907 [hydrothermal vent metagenome]|uniref:Tll0287-like domain-containing protein n=1 Tax=hydrothermal vent metagenome TaxID=652676 RepID=A0A3B1BJK4_9ZZZZ